MKNEQIFRYNGNQITFLNNDGNTMMNATEMAKPFGKKSKDFFKIEQSKDFCITLCKSKSLIIKKGDNSPLLNASDFSEAFPELVLCRKGSSKFGGGVWMQEDLALEFARWLSPNFHLWCKECFKAMKARICTENQNVNEQKEDEKNDAMVFQYCGNQVTFLSENKGLMVNVTEMAKPFGKRANDFLSLRQTQDLMLSLSAKTGIPVLGLVTVNQGGSNPGTWMHEDLALIFAQWLSPDFYLWCNDRIKEILLGRAHHFTQEHPIDSEKLQLAHALQLATDFINDNLPRMWYPSGNNSIAPMILTDLVDRIRERVYVEDLEVAEYLCSLELLNKSDDGFFYPTQEALDNLLLDIRQVTIQRVDGKRLSFGLPVFTEQGLQRLESVIVPLKQRQEILMNTQLFRRK